MSLAVAVFDSYYLALLIANFFTASTSSSDLSSLSLVKFAFAISIYELYACLHVSAVTVLAFTIGSTSMTLCLSSQFFVMYNGVLLRSL